MHRPAIPLLALALLVLALPAARAADAPPVAPVHDVVDEYWGVKVHDPYRYMENLDDPIVRGWIHGEAAYTSRVLSRIPVRDDLLARLEELDAGRPYRIMDIQRRADGGLFYQKIRSDENVARLYFRPSLAGDETLLVDPSAQTPPDGGHYSLEWYVPSPDGSKLLYGLAASGSEQDVLHVLDRATGKDLPDVIDRMESGYTLPQWLPDGSGFYYSRRQELAADAPPTDGYKLSRAYLHRLGADPAGDAVVFAHDLWPDVPISDVDFPSVVLTPGSPWAIGKIKHGDANQLTLYAARLAPDGSPAAGADGASPWRMLCDVPDSVTAFAVHGGAIDLLTCLGAPRFRVVREALDTPGFAKAAPLVPAGKAVIRDLMAASDALYLELQSSAAIAVARLPYQAGAALEPLTLPDRFPSAGLVAVSPDVPGAYVATSAWTRAGRTYAYDPASGSFRDTGLSPQGKYDDVPGYESVEVEVPGHDGAMVPLSIVYKSGIKLDGSHPTLLIGYGSYGISLNVRFRPTILAWLERGGVFAVAHVRGGGELGEDWHLAGQKLNKPNTWKDFIACAQYLVDKGYTTPARLAGEGGSAGGITIGRAITERPDLFAAALVDVGSTDTIRSEFTTNGVPNIPEFGTVTKQDEFQGLLRMSTYANVKDGVKYPAVMLTHGLNDPRVEPWETAKLTARLQAATASGKPVLFRVEEHAGHGIGSTRSQRLAETADQFAFLLWQMGMVKPLP